MTEQGSITKYFLNKFFLYLNFNLFDYLHARDVLRDLIFFIVFIKNFCAILSEKAGNR